MTGIVLLSLSFPLLSFDRPHVPRMYLKLGLSDEHFSKITSWRIVEIPQRIAGMAWYLTSGVVTARMYAML